jgi:hypothetical protein
MPFLDRPQLDDRLRAALAVGSVVLHASLGYGKTTVLRSALRDLATPVARYDTAPWDRDRFALPLIDAVAAMRPDFGRRTRALAEAGAAPEALAAAFADELAHMPAPLVIAIDNAGDIAGDEGFRSFLRALAQAVPDYVRIAFASRRGVADLLRAPVAQVDESDLRFSLEEIGRLTGTTDATTIRRIADATAGWPEFARDVSIEASDDASAWRPVARGRIARYAFGAPELTVGARGDRARFWRATIEDRDDLPVAGLRATGYAPTHVVVFEARPRRSYRVQWGADDAAPSCDLRDRLAHDAPTAFLAATVGQPQSPRAARTPERPPKRSGVLALAFCLALLALGGITFATLRGLPRSTRGP